MKFIFHFSSLFWIHMREVCWLRGSEESLQGKWWKSHATTSNAKVSFLTLFIVVVWKWFHEWKYPVVHVTTNFGNQSSIRTHVSHSWTHMGLKLLFEANIFSSRTPSSLSSSLWVFACFLSQEAQHKSDLWSKRWWENIWIHSNIFLCVSKYVKNISAKASAGCIKILRNLWIN